MSPVVAVVVFFFFKSQVKIGCSWEATLKPTDWIEGLGMLKMEI